MNPADELRTAATKLRGLIAAVPSDHWGERPWHAEECSDTDTMESCPCIVAQDEYRNFDEPQIPPVQYVADAEGPEFAAYIAVMHPGVGAALADWLDEELAQLENDDFPGIHERALAVARQINGSQQ